MHEPPIDRLKAVAHPLRFAILTALAGKELNVGEIETETGIGQPTLSQQLSVLRNAGLVDSRREAKLVFYCSVPSAMSDVVDSLRAIIPPADPRDDARPAKPGGEEARANLGGAAAFARLD